MAQYYMLPQAGAVGTSSSQKAVENAPDNYLVCPGTRLILYMQQNETEKAAALLENMAVSFLG